MTLKIYVSTENTDEARQYRHAVNIALFSVQQFPLTALSNEHTQRNQEAHFLIKGSDVFIGVYEASYGNVPPGEHQSCTERDYHIAHELGLQCLIFMPEDARHTTDERQKAFKKHLEEHHVIHYFQDVDALRAAVLMNVDKFRRIHRDQRSTLLMPPRPSRDEVTTNLSRGVSSILNPFRQRQNTEDIPPPLAPPAPAPASPQEPPSPEPVEDEINLDDVEMPLMELARQAEQDDADTDIEALQAQGDTPADDAESLHELVNQALIIAEPDIEQILRRVLETHEAQRLLRQQNQAASRAKAWMQVNPIFGEPLDGAQFEADIFMIMPFREHFDAIYNNLVIPTVLDLNLTIKRGDDFTSVSGAIMREVWAAIHACRLVIVETTEVNANVYYELGIAHTLGKPAILLTQHTDTDDLPFDLRHLRFIKYQDSIQGGLELKARLKTQILNIINDLNDDEPALPS